MINDNKKIVKHKMPTIFRETFDKWGDFGRYLLDGRREVLVLIATLTAATPYLGWLSLVLVCLLTLRKGILSGFLVLAWAILPAIISGFWVGSWSVALESIIAYFVLWGLAGVLRVTASWQYVLEIASAIAIAVVLFFHWLIPDLNSFYLDYFLGMYKSSHVDPDTYANMTTYLQSLVDYLLGIQTTMYMLHNLLFLLVARGLQAFLYNPQGLSRDLKKIRLGWTSWGVLVVLLFLSFKMSLPWAMDCLPVVTALFFLAGLSMAHCLIQVKMPYKGMVVLFYLLLILLVPFSVLAIISLAFIDTGWDLRKKFLKGSIS